MVLPELVGTIDLNTCVGLVSAASQEINTSIGAAIAVLGFGMLFFMILFAFENQEKKMMKSFLVKEGALNKYENWKKDRKLLE
jgi:hypothetical protein